MPRKPRQEPKEGHIVSLRGRGASGILRKILPRKWCKVEWQSEKKGPLLVHLNELEVVM